MRRFRTVRKNVEAYEVEFCNPDGSTRFLGAIPVALLDLEPP